MQMDAEPCCSKIDQTIDISSRYTGRGTKIVLSKIHDSTLIIAYTLPRVICN